MTVTLPGALATIVAPLRLAAGLPSEAHEAGA
jgi:hypothetical protein